MSDPNNLYKAPSNELSEEEEKIIELLLRFKRKLKVVNMLRQDGMSYEDAMNRVNHLTPLAQSIINKRHIGWRLVGGLLLLMGIALLARMIYIAVFGFSLVIVLSVFFYGSYFCFQRRDIIQ